MRVIETEAWTAVHAPGSRGHLFSQIYIAHPAGGSGAPHSRSPKLFVEAQPFSLHCVTTMRVVVPEWTGSDTKRKPGAGRIGDYNGT